MTHNNNKNESTEEPKVSTLRALALFKNYEKKCGTYEARRSNKNELTA